MELFQIIEKSIIKINESYVLIDSDVALLYGVETKRINEAVKNNQEKFPEGYIITISKNNFNDLRSKNSTANFSKKRYDSKAFTEKGLYMLATILKSPKATETTIAIIETFTKIRHLGRNLKELRNSKNEIEKKSLIQKSGEIFTQVFSNELDVNETETTIELNFAVLKLKHTIKTKT